MWSRSLPALVGGLFLLVTLSGCGDDPGDDAAVSLELWTIALSPFFDDYMEGEVARFERANPGVSVTWVDVPYDALDRKLIASASAGRGPDVVNFSDMNFARYVALGAVADLSERLPAPADAQYMEQALPLCTPNGTLRALPWYLSTQVRFCNTDLLRAGGVEPGNIPRQWSELRSRAAAFREQTGSYLCSVRLGAESDLPMLLLAEGLAPFTPDASGRVRADLTTPEIVEYIDAWVQLYRAGDLPREAATGGHAHLIELYQAGQIGIIHTGAQFLNRIKDTAPSVYASTEVRPATKGALGRTHIAMMLVSVMRGSEHPDAAARLAWSLTGPESQAALAREAAILPSTRETPSTGSTLAAPIERARAVAAADLQNAVAFTPAIDSWPDLRRTFEEGIKRALLSDMPTSEALARIERDWNRILASGTAATMDAIPDPAPVDPALQASLP